VICPGSRPGHRGLYGGVGYGKQLEQLKKGVDIIVATPGRLLDHLQRGTCKLDRIEFLVLDEADRMLDMGFLPDVRRIIERCPATPDLALFGHDPARNRDAGALGHEKPGNHRDRHPPGPGRDRPHAVYPVSDQQKADLLLALLEAVNYDSAIIFCRTKHRADRIANVLRRNNHAVAVLHSNRTQREREQALRGFRDGKFEALVATDIAARGLDIADVSHVINYDVPQHPEDYVHRIGRTGRAQATGDAFTLMVAEDGPHMDAIERFICRKIERLKLPNFNYTYTTLFDDSLEKRGVVAGRARGARIRGGYFFGPLQKRR
jgi:ATP-dependent RNA helicase RhlE